MLIVNGLSPCLVIVRFIRETSINSLSPSWLRPCATTFRMTFGSASPAKVAIGTQRMPSGARVRAGTFAV